MPAARDLSASPSMCLSPSLVLRRLGQSVLLFCGLAGAWSPLPAQGPLTPPGAPTPTMKTLDQIEARTPIQSLPGDSTNLFIISQPGSYYLTGNITAVSGKACIGLANFLSNVTIDLNGFTLFGAAGARPAIDGPQATVLYIFNGTLANFPGLGINLGIFARSRIERVSFVNCAGGGAAVGCYSVVKDCTFQACGSVSSPSLSGLSETLVDHCVVVGNPTGDGIQVDYSSIVSNCIVSENSGSGIVANGGSVRFINDNCFANLVDGIRGSNFADVVDCTCSLNGTAGNTATSAGIHLIGQNGRVDHCFTTNNRGRGIAVDSSNAATTVTRNTSFNNTGSNYAIASGNRAASIVTYNAASGFTSGDPLANTQ